MNVLFLSNLYPPNSVGGYERLCHAVAATFVTRGHRVSVLTSCYGSEPARHDGQVIYQALQLLVGTDIYTGFPGSERRRSNICLANLSAVQKVIETERPDIIFCWNLYGLDRSVLDKLCNGGIPLVLMLTDNWLIEMYNPEFIYTYMDSQLSGVGITPFRWLNPQKHLNASAVFGAQFLKDIYAASGITFNDGLVVHNGVRQRSRSLSVTRDRGGLVNESEVRLLFAGRIVELKGAHTAIEALGLLNSRSQSTKRYHLTIVGDDPNAIYRNRLHGLAKQLSFVDCLEYRPQVSEDQLFELFQEYDIYIFPSLYEPFSLTLIHALAAGIPTVASRVGGNPEIVLDDDTGLIFDRQDSVGLAEAIHRLANDPTQRVRLSRRAREIAAGFTFERMVNGMEAFLVNIHAAVH